MNLREFQSEVGTWHVEHFGALGENPHLLAKFKEETGEFLDAGGEKTEAADVIIVLIAWAHRNGIDLEHELRAKFDIVKGRDQLSRDRIRGLSV